jgi:hypothetical protein
LTKLYKRRVELDFSRKGSTAPRSGSFSTAGNLLGAGSSSTGGATPITPGLLAAASARTIAASLTCCRHCGLAYLDNYVGLLTCRASPPTVDFRGQLASRHSAIVGWSLTSYLKTLHSGGFGRLCVLCFVGCSKRILFMRELCEWCGQSCRASHLVMSELLACCLCACAGGMGWDAIYWHVWAACVVFRADHVMISALEVDRYVVEPDGLLIRSR